MKTDYIIVGAGPAGLAMAYYLATYNYKVLILEREKSIGGCHRVRRVNGMFTEHGPRIYFDNYLTFKDLLKSMGHDFNDLFTPYNFSIATIGGQNVMTSLRPYELLWLTYAFIRHTFNHDWSKSITLLEFAKQNKFTEHSIDYLDRLCRLTDGGGIDVYTLYEFLEIPNQNALYQIYQPKLPNDIGLLSLWKDALLRTNNVEIRLNEEVKGFESSNNELLGVYTKDHQRYLAKRVIMAVNPKAMVSILNNQQELSLRNAFGNLNQLKKWEQASRYIVYVPITYHWNTKVNFPKIWGFPKNDWAIAFIVLTDYMDTRDPRSKTLVSVCITRLDTPSRTTGKTCNQSSIEEIKQEAYRQLEFDQYGIPMPTTSIMSPGVYYNENEKRWQTKDSSFILTTNAEYGPTFSPVFDNLYWIGTHNGFNNYSFTALETAVSNALGLMHRLHPESKNRFRIHHITTLVNMVTWILFLLIILYLYRNEIARLFW